ncbi:MAG TPA: hypothetical protein VGG51_01045 [Candidatus Cybelea sp.]
MAPPRFKLALTREFQSIELLALLAPERLYYERGERERPGAACGLWRLLAAGSIDHFKATANPQTTRFKVEIAPTQTE